MKTNQAGIEHLKKLEGLRLEPYNDVAGYPTIGYGHLIKPGENFTKITEKEAEAILRNDLSIAEEAVNKYVESELNENQFAALVSFVFNVGVGAFKKSTLLKRLNTNDFDNVPYQLKRWNRAGGKVVNGLIKRRKAEAELFTA